MAILFNIDSGNYEEIDEGMAKGQEELAERGEPTPEAKEQLMKELGRLAGLLGIDVEW